MLKRIREVPLDTIPPIQLVPQHGREEIKRRMSDTTILDIVRVIPSSSSFPMTGRPTNSYNSERAQSAASTDTVSILAHI